MILSAPNEREDGHDNHRRRTRAVKRTTADAGSPSLKEKAAELKAASDAIFDPTTPLERLAQLFGTPVMRDLMEAVSEKVYVSFTQRIEDAPADGEGGRRPTLATFGPYQSVEVYDGEIHVYNSEAEDDVILADDNGPDWAIPAGPNGEPPFDGHVKFHTYLPAGTVIRPTPLPDSENDGGPAASQTAETATA
jgi:hypothetical protein